MASVDTTIQLIRTTGRNAEGQPQEACSPALAKSPGDFDRELQYGPGSSMGDVIPTGSVTFPLGSFIDPSQPTIAEIIGQTGAGIHWTPTNDLIDGPVSEDVYHVFTMIWHNDARKMGGSYTTRTCTGCYLQRPATSSVAAPTQLQYSIKVYGTITDAVVSVS